MIRYTKECREAAEGRYPVGPDGKRPVSIKVQENWWLENVFGRAHPITPIFWFGPPALYGLWRGLGAHGVGMTLAYFVAGWLVWSALEYVLHRFVFHFNAVNEQERLTLFLLHGYHHEYADDPMRLVLPPIGIWPVAVVIGGLWYLIFGAYFWPVFAGTALGYIAYDWTHYYTHYFNPKSGPGRWLKRYHMLHHHDSPLHRYGITSPLWDLVFGTYLPINKLVRQAGRNAPPAGAPADQRADI